MNIWQGVINQYRSFLPITDATPVVTLNEGNTPLIRARNLERKLRAQFQIWLKCEGLNPTASFKDRGMTVAVSKALERGAKVLICASTGNTSAAAAAYAARARVKCVVILPEGSIAKGKLAQALMYGATVVAVRGNFDDALRIVCDFGKKRGFAIVNSINPDRIEGQKTAAFEVCEWLGDRAPDYHILPVGNAGNITAYWKGYCEFHSRRIIPNLPRMIGFQASGAAPIVRGRIVKNPQTIATAIRIGNPASWNAAVAARNESGGLIATASDEEIIAAYKLLAKTEGIFAEPASAITIAGLAKLIQRNYFKPDTTVVCTLTGHGLKDPEIAIGQSKAATVCDPITRAVMKAIGA
jgi:threonine synthase